MVRYMGSYGYEWTEKYVGGLVVLEKEARVSDHDYSESE